jgi:hypothetical protein
MAAVVTVAAAVAAVAGPASGMSTFCTESKTVIVYQVVLTITNCTVKIRFCGIGAYH